MTDAAIEALPVSDLACDDAHLYLWTINSRIEAAYRIAARWGFQPSSLLVWCKTPASMTGGTFGNAAEFVLFCRRGSLAASERLPRNWFTWPMPYAAGSNHGPIASAKPEAFLDLVEQVSPGPYLELFARRQRLGWDTWGDEALEHVTLRGGGAA